MGKPKILWKLRWLEEKVAEQTLIRLKLSNQPWRIEFLYELSPQRFNIFFVGVHSSIIADSSHWFHLTAVGQETRTCDNESPLIDF